MAPRKTGLGRGLDGMIPSYAGRGRTEKANSGKKKETSLIEEELEEENEGKTSKKKQGTEPPAEKKEKSGERLVNINEVSPNREQPRKQFDEESLKDLSESIRQYGVLQPLLVQKKGDYYEIIAGERRWRAARMAGLKEIPVLVKEFSEEEAVAVSLIENIQREDLNPIEEALAYKRLTTEYQLTQEDLAKKVSKSRTAITNSMRLLKLCEKVQKMLAEEEISGGHARALLSIEDAELQYKLAVKIADEHLSVRETEKLVKSELSPRKEKPKEQKDHALEYIYKDMEEKMKGSLGTKVSVHPKADQKGKIEIEYYSREELERIYEMILNAR